MLFTNHLPQTYEASFSESHLTHLHKYQNDKQIFRSWKRLWFSTHSHCTPMPYLDNSAARVHDLGSRSQHHADRSRWSPGHDWTNVLRLWRQFIATPPIAAIEIRTGVWMIHKRSAVGLVQLQLLGTALWMRTAFRIGMPSSLSHGAACGLTPSHRTIIIRLVHTKSRGAACGLTPSHRTIIIRLVHTKSHGAACGLTPSQRTIIIRLVHTKSNGAACGLTPSHRTIIIRPLHTKWLCA